MSRGGPSRVLITGATGALGAALARLYAGGAEQMILHGRRSEVLADVAADCRDRGAEIITSDIDLTDTSALYDWLDLMSQPEVPDLVIACAGINTHVEGVREDTETVVALLYLNLYVPIAMVNHLAPKMCARGRGQLVLMSSLAGFHGLPLTPSYCASKAGLKAYGEAMRGVLAPHGVGVSVVMPGYVSSRMAEAMPGPKPFVWQPGRAARRIQRGIARNAPRITFPFPLNLATWSLAVLPPRLAQWLLRVTGYRPG